jgi:hypothetical protein
MKHVMAFATIGACLLVLSGGAALATDAHKVLGTTGQSGTGGAGVASCGAAGTTLGSIQAGPPGQVNSSSSVNSPFPTQGDPSPNKQYAGTPGAGNSASNAHANSQYDNACFQHQVP